MEFEKKKVIIADDSHVYLMYMGIVLKRMGFRVIAAQNGQEVLNLLKLVEPDLVILNTIMSGMDGGDVLRLIKNDKQTSHIPVIMVSQDASAETVGRCTELGCAAFLSKPVKIDRLHEVLQDHIFSSMGTKRKHLRVPFRGKVHVACDGTSFDLYGETIGEGGMYIRKKDPLPVGTSVEVTLPLGDGVPIRLRGVVVYVKGLFTSVFKYPPGMAIEFKGVSSAEAEMLRSNVEKTLAQDIFESQEETVFVPSSKMD